MCSSISTATRRNGCSTVFSAPSFPAACWCWAKSRRCSATPAQSSHPSTPVSASSAAPDTRTEEAREIRVKVADYAVASSGTISTIGLGSCVAIVLYDALVRVGGLAHVLLPNEAMARDRSNPAKFPATAVPLLLEKMRALGAVPDRIHAKVVGGASMFGNLFPPRHQHRRAQSRRRAGRTRRRQAADRRPG